MMKKIKDFFKKQKQRFASWYSETYYPVKRVILLITLCSLVAFGLGSCSAKKPYKQASAAPTADKKVIWITINYQPQFYYPTSDGTVEVKLASDTQLFIRDGAMYYKFFKNEVLLSNSTTSTYVYYYQYRANEKAYTYSSMPVGVASTIDTNLLAKVYDGSYYISNISFENYLHGSNNYCFFSFNVRPVGGGDSHSLGAVYITCNRTVPEGYDFKLTSVPFFSYNIVTSDVNSDAYRLGYEQGYNKGVSESLKDISPWQVLVQGVDDLFNAKIFGNISIGLLFELGLGIILFGFMIKLFFGG